jgi:hypothetical protein
MRKDPSWFIGAGGLLCFAMSAGALYLSRHPEVASRFATAATQGAAHEVSGEDGVIDESAEPSTEPVHFLSEQAIAQEYHRQADLPFNMAPAGTKQGDKEEDDESPPPGHTPKNRLPGKITFAEETQEPSEFDSLFNAGDESDDVKPLNKAAGADENDPRVMDYCVEEGEEKREMPYAEEEESSNEWSTFLKIGSEAASDTYSSIPLSQDDVETIIDQQSEETKKHLVLFEGTINGDGTVNGEVRPYFETGFFNLPEQLPWINSSSPPIQNPCESIDTIWPLNLLGQSFRGLLSRLTSDPNRRMSELLIQSEPRGFPDFETLVEEAKKLKDDKPSRISPERVHGGIQ